MRRLGFMVLGLASIVISTSVIGPMIYKDHQQQKNNQAAL